MLKKPFFSIVIPLYNKEKHIESTIKSILKQSMQDFEVIVVNDGSTDSSCHEVKTINDNRILLYSIKNKGVSHARNFGIKKANAKLIVFLDADDIWLNNHLEDLKELYESFPNCGMYCKAYTKQYRKTFIKSVYKNIPQKNNWKGIVDDFFESSTINCIAWTSAVMIPEKIINDIGYFDENITLGAGEDTDLWIRIALKYKVAFSNKPSAIHNLGADNRISNSNTNARIFLNLDKYEAVSKKSKALKVYLDLNRYSIAIQYKIAGNTEKANEYIDKIDKDNLNRKQLFLLKRNTFFIKLMLNIKKLLRFLNIDLSTFK
ncbi:glycosyltransferase family 2 protein [Algibacter sp. R77976]|uniref:glycosyltransferase family 2 protein n=1 Tax=Algibacter sp. R77976 TaxID=3093873 RepID=UPI0037C859A4